MEDFLKWLIELNRFSGIAGCLFFIFFSKSQNQTSRVLFFVLLISLLADNLNFFFIRLIYPNAYYIGNIWQLLNYALSILLFIKILNHKKAILIALFVIYAVGSIVSFALFFDFSESNTFIRTFANASFILLSLWVFLDLLKNPNEGLKKHPIFWIATAYFVYNSLLLLHGVFNNYLIFDLKISAEAYSLIAIINLIANITKNYIFFYALVLLSKNVQKPSKKIDFR